MEPNNGGGKIRSKRQHEAKPYGRVSKAKPTSNSESKITNIGERFVSLFGQVKDMFSPSWLVDLVTKARKKNDVITTQSEEPTVEKLGGAGSAIPNSAPITNYPIVYSVPREPSSGGPGPMVTSTPYPGPPPEMPFQHYPKGYQMPQPTSSTGGDDQSEHSDYSVSTSGCSSMVPHPDRRDYQKEILQLNDSKLQQMQQDLQPPRTPVEGPRNVQYPARTSFKEALAEQEETQAANTSASFLWSQSISKVPGESSSKRPTFNVSLFASPATNRSIFGTSPHESSFYPGKTTFGGASSQKRLASPGRTPYQPMRRQVRAKPATAASDSVASSSTAKRILEALEKMSTPLSDAKKIPANRSSEVDSVLSFTPNAYKRRRAESRFPTQQRESLQSSPFKLGPPSQGLSTPGIASVSSNMAGRLARRKLDSFEARSQSTSLAQQSQEDRESRPEVPAEKLPNRLPTGGTGKMKREKSYHKSKRTTEEDDEEVEVPDLPTGFTLPVSSMPKFDFQLAAPSDKDKSGYKFSSPIREPANSPGSTVKHPDEVFTFRSPVKVEEAGGSFLSGNTPKMKSDSPPPPKPSVQFSSSTTAGSSLTSGFRFSYQTMDSEPSVSEKASDSYGFKPATELKQGSVMDILGKSSPSVSTGGFQPAKELKQGSVMDILGKNTSSSPGLKPAAELKSGSVLDILGKSKDTSADSKNNNLAEKFKPPSGSWECPTCMIQNKEDASKCVACETSKPGATSKPETTGSLKDSALLNKFKPPSGNWECPTCMIDNKADVTKCVACEAAKPGSSSQDSTKLLTQSKPLVPKDNSLAAQFKPPAGSWECPACMLDNKAEQDKCVACETARPGAGPRKPASAQSSSASTDLALASKFKPPAGNWDCDTCMVNNKAEVSKCVACETPRPGAKPPTGFISQGSFKFKEATSDNLSQTSSSASGFKFGGPLSSVSNIPSSSDNKDTKSAPSSDTQVAGFKFGSQGGFSFGSKPAALDKVDPSAGFKFNSDTKFGATEKTSNAQEKTETQAKESSSAQSTTGFGGFKLPGAIGNGPVDGSKDSGSIGGFSFGAALTSQTAPKDNVKTAQSSAPSVGGFSFTGAKPTEATVGIALSQSAPVSEQSNEQPKPSIGGFSFGQKPTSIGTQPQSSTGGFSFGIQTSKTDTSKSDAIPSSAPFAFGQKPSFDPKTAFGSDSKPPLGTAPAQMGDKPAASGLFQFGTGQQSSLGNSTGLGVFGQPTTTASTTPTSAFSQSGALTTMTSSSGNTFGSSADAKSAGIFSVGLSTKRSHDDVEEPGGKKGKADTGFSFGSATSTTSSTPAFQFMASGSNGNTNTAGVFGQQNKPSAFSGFGTGTSATTANSTPSIFGSGAAQSASIAPFGAASTLPTSSAPILFGSVATPGTVSTTTTTASLFGMAPSTSTSTAGQLPAFGAFATPNKTPFRQTDSSKPAPAINFNFGGAGSNQPSSNTNSGSTGVFQFGAKEEAPPNSGSGFGFGQQMAAPAPGTTPGFNFSATPSINFTGGSQGAQTFQFGAGTPGGAGSNPFSVQSSGSANQRKIRRATRKIKK